MARSDRRGQKHGAGHGSQHHDAPEISSMSETQQEQLASLLASVPAVARSLRDAAPAGRDALLA
ncbi:MAG: hypothetical protein ACRDHP_00585, partial [Ktedonobacterales bacterium]